MGMGTGDGTSRATYRPMSEINVTPLVDVMLVLLIIFMVASPMMVAGVNVDLPETKATPVESEQEPLAITIDSKGKLYLQETEITMENLAPKLQAITKEKKDTRIFVRGDRTLDYGLVMKVVGEINAAGFNQVALITDVAN
jgi:biopolymer transport protein TolR